MNTTRNILATSLVVATVAGAAVGPLAQSADAMTLADLKKPQKATVVKTDKNAAVDLMTELDCGSHMLTAKVTNKTEATIHPDVLFNGESQQKNVAAVDIKPGETQSFFYYFTGNEMIVTVEARGEGFETAKTSPMVDCLEPVSFKATDWSDSAIVGELRNNSTIVAQTAYTQVGEGDVRVESLEPGETRMVAMPFHGYYDQKIASVKIATEAGYESSYMVDLDELPLPQPIPLE